MGLELFVENQEARLPTVTTIKVIFQYTDFNIDQAIFDAKSLLNISPNKSLDCFLGTRRNRLEGGNSFLYEES